MKISNEVKSNNAKYTNECKEIYDNLHFAKITSKVLEPRMILYASCLILLFACLFIFAFVFEIIKNGNSKILLTALMIVGICLIPVIIIVTIIYHKKFKKKKEPCPWYFIKCNDIEYIIRCREENDALNMISVNNFAQKRILLFKNNEISFGTIQCDTIDSYTGFKQYICNVNRVFDSKVVTSPRLRYKKKKQVKNKTIYYFRSVDSVWETKYPRSLILENNVLKEICVQELFTRPGSSKNSDTTEMFKYYFVNDNSVKIHIPKKVLEEAKKNNFKMPFCDNIVYDD